MKVEGVILFDLLGRRTRPYTHVTDFTSERLPNGGRRSMMNQNRTASRMSGI